MTPSLFVPSHSDLVDLAGKWLLKSSYKNGYCMAGPCPIVVTELSTAAEEQPDAIGWHSGKVVLVEVKVSRSDFFADAKKPFRLAPELGMGDYRWFLCPEGMILPEEVPDSWGLLWAVDGGKIRVKKDPSLQKSNRKAEAYLLVSVIRRQAGLAPLRVDGRGAKRESAEA